MKSHLTFPVLAGAIASSLSASVSAHDGHGLLGSHWHATDAWGLVALAAVVAAAIWFSRGGKP